MRCVADPTCIGADVRYLDFNMILEENVTYVCFNFCVLGIGFRWPDAQASTSIGDGFIVVAAGISTRSAAVPTGSGFHIDRNWRIDFYDVERYRRECFYSLSRSIPAGGSILRSAWMMASPY